MGLFKKKPQDPEPPKDPRDPVGQNPTGNPRKSSAGKRRQAANKADRDLQGSRWGKKKKS